MKKITDIDPVILEEIKKLNPTHRVINSNRVINILSTLEMQYSKASDNEIYIYPQSTAKLSLLKENLKKIGVEVNTNIQRSNSLKKLNDVVYHDFKINDTFDASQRQNIVFNVLCQTDLNLVIEAVAGSGKTTTIVNAAKFLLSYIKQYIRYRKNIGFFCFNTSIRDELVSRFQNEKNEIAVRTLHQYGLYCTRRGRKVILNKNKVQLVLEEKLNHWFNPFAPEFDKAYVDEYMSTIEELVNLFRLYNASSTEEIRYIADKYDISIEDDMPERILETIKDMKLPSRKYRYSKTRVKCIFDDTEFLSTEFGIDTKKRTYRESQKYIESVKYGIEFGELVDMMMRDSSMNWETLRKYIAFQYRTSLDKAVILKLLPKVQDMLDTFLDIDFTDMLYVPATDKHIGDAKIMEWFDIIFVDEAQDLSRIQIAMLDRMRMRPGARIISVGDTYQCQPPESIVTLHDGKEVRIDSVIKGDRVVSYDAHQKGGFVNYHETENLAKRYRNSADEILDIQTHHYSGRMIKVQTKLSENISKYTPNHRCIVRFKKSERYILYLMENQGKFRIGINPLYSVDGFGLNSRSRQEKAEKSWILGTYANKRNAFIAEQFHSSEFGIPQLRFVDNIQQDASINQDEMDLIWNRFNLLKMKQGAIELLKKFNREYDFPMWERHNSEHHSRSGICEVRASNLISEIMLLPVFDKSTKTGNKTHKAIFEEFIQEAYQYDGLVYSLKVSGRELYIADNILTHNSIYGFAGSDIECFEQLKNLPNTVTLPLSVSYRCCKAAVRLAQSINPFILWHESAIEGEVRDGTSKEISDIDDSAVLCRNNAPLVSFLYMLIAQGKSAHIAGKKTSEGLIKHIKRYKTISEMYKKMKADEKKILTKIIETEKIKEDKAKQDQKYISAIDKRLCLESISNNANCKSIEDLEVEIKRIFFDEEDPSKRKPGIVLSSMHKSKGLEWNNVYILCIELNEQRISFCKREWQKQQEFNLKYVAFTRPKEKLIFIKDFIYDKYNKEGVVNEEIETEKISQQESQQVNQDVVVVDHYEF